MRKLHTQIPKILTLMIAIMTAACATNKPEQLVDYEPCSVASNAAELKSNEFYPAFDECRKQATEGNPVSQKNLAYMYYFGTPNLPEDKAKGVWWLKVAADNGSATAEARLSMIGEWITWSKYGHTWDTTKVASFRN